MCRGLMPGLERKQTMERSTKTITPIDWMNLGIALVAVIFFCAMVLRIA